MSDDSPQGEGPPREVTPVAEVVCRCPQNRELLTVVSNLFVEAEEHARGLGTLYQMIQSLAHPIPRSWAARLYDEYKRHYDATERNLVGVRTYLDATKQ